jgi:radical SAM superfamily enzyme YgiQ (UPF0313 family)
MKKILLVHPHFPVTYWGFQDALRIVDRKAALPPLGLITLAAALPARWELRLVDLNCGPLRDEDLRWADVVFTGGMLIQLESMREVMARAHALGRPVVVGGPTATTCPDVFADADVIFQGEAEGRIDEIVEAVDALGPPATGQLVVPAGEGRPDISQVPTPRFDLLNVKDYTTMSIQYSRGCPFRCEFCDIVELFGHTPRVKTNEQVLAELESIRRLGFKGSVFVVDDNFIGKKRAVRELLPLITEWQREHGMPFDFYTEASIDLASDDELMTAMIAAGFRSVFVGIETPSKSALAEAHKGQNLRMDLAEAVDRMTAAGLEVMGGFIVGFDSDRDDIFEAQREFIQRSPVVLAMVGVLFALPGTALWRRLAGTDRLRDRSVGDQFGRSNFLPVMDEERLLRGYRELMRELYSAEAFYGRCENYLDRVGEIPHSGDQGLDDILYFVKIAFGLGVRSPRRRLFWRLLNKARTGVPHGFKWAVVKALQGEHMIRYTEEHVLPRLDRAIAEVVAEKRARAAGESARAHAPRERELTPLPLPLPAVAAEPALPGPALRA